MWGRRPGILILTKDTLIAGGCRPPRGPTGNRVASGFLSHTHAQGSSEYHTRSCVLKLINRSDIESVARSRTGSGKSLHFPPGVGVGRPPPISMTSWLLTGANRPPFEAFPQKPHPLEREVKNTELEIASPQATCQEEAGQAVTPPCSHRCKKGATKPLREGQAGSPADLHPRRTAGQGGSTAEKPPSAHFCCPKIRLS